MRSDKGEGVPRVVAKVVIAVVHPDSDRFSVSPVHVIDPSSRLRLFGSSRATEARPTLRRVSSRNRSEWRNASQTKRERALSPRHEMYSPSSVPARELLYFTRVAERVGVYGEIEVLGGFLMQKRTRKNMSPFDSTIKKTRSFSALQFIILYSCQKKNEFKKEL